VPNGTYSLVSVATDTVAEATTSASVSVTVDNAPPTTAVLIPSSGTTQSGTTAVLDASSSANVTTVTYELSGGPSNLSDQSIATGSPTYYGWLAQWNTTAVPNGTYSLVSMASYLNGVSTTSAPVTINVKN
jgi:Rieske Fe-S protein